MNEEKELLTEDNYRKTKKKISKIAIIVLIIGIIVGGSLIATGIMKQIKINNKYSETNKTIRLEELTSEKDRISAELENEKENLLTSKTELVDKIKPTQDEIKKLERVTFNGFDDAYYERKDKIEELKKSIANDEKSISIIDNVLNETFDACIFNNNTYTQKYCELKNKLEETHSLINNIDKEYSDFNKKFDSHDSIPFYMFGAFVIIASCMIAGSIYMTTKRREIMSFQFQQVMPVAKEGLEKMAPTVGKVGTSIAKEIAPAYKEIAKEMAPAYGEIAKEISKGIKEGMKDEK